MRKVMLFAAVLTVAAMFCGCAGIQTTTPEQLNGENIANSGNSVAHLNASNWGFYFFMFPLITGSTDEPGKMEFLKDTVQTANVVDMMTRKSKELGATSTLDLTSRHTSLVWFFGFREVQVTGNAVK